MISKNRIYVELLKSLPLISENLEVAEEPTKLSHEQQRSHILNLACDHTLPTFKNNIYPSN
jgi:hypothetical protein